jgi:hypothetical protein
VISAPKILETIYRLEDSRKTSAVQQSLLNGGDGEFIFYFLFFYFFFAKRNFSFLYNFYVEPD